MSDGQKSVSNQKELLMRFGGVVLLMPHAALTVLAIFNLTGDIGLLDVSGQKVLNIVLGCIIGLGEWLTCLALWKPGKFTSFGWQSRVRIAAAGWNFINGAWLANLILRHAGLDRMQYGEMVLAFVTLSALLVFAVEDKK